MHDRVVYRITQWMEKGIFPQLTSSQSHHIDDVNPLHSFQFCILSTHLKLTTEGNLIRTNDSLEIFHFHLVSSEREETQLDKGKKPLVGQLKAALENITHCLEETRTRKKSVVSVNIIMEFKDCALRDEVADENLSDERDEECQMHSDEPIVQPEFFSRSNVSHPLGMMRVVRDKRGSNDIVEIEEEIFDSVGRSYRHDYSAHVESQSKFSGVDQLAQSSQSQETNYREEGRRDIGRVDLPHHTVVISREYRMLDHDLNSGDEELKRLFPDHRAQVKAIINDDARREGDKMEELETENVTPVKSSLASIGSGKKRKRSTPPLTPMRIRHNQDKGYKMPPSSYSPRLKIRLERTTSEDFDACGQERTPVITRNRDASQSSPMRSSALFVTPKSRSGKKQSPRSGSPSEAPTLVEPFSSGMKNSIIGEHLASLSSIPRPTFHSS